MSVYRQSRGPANSCPRCGETLVANPEREGIRACPNCGGIFANLATSQRIVETLDHQLLSIGFEASLGKAKPRDEGYPVTCPDCQIEMVKKRIESAVCDIDACPLHGTWFDTGEFVDVMRALARARKKGIVLTRTESSPDLTAAAEDPPTESTSFIDWLDRWWSGR